jgi:photosystem II stability/assembly factor-like uncharacterized protein
MLCVAIEMLAPVALRSLFLAMFCCHCTFYLRQPTDKDANAGAGTGSGGEGAMVEGGVVGNPPPGEWSNRTGNLSGMPAGFANLTLVSAKPDEDKLIAGVSVGGLWLSEDGGMSWSTLGANKKSASIINRPSAIIYDPISPDVFWESGTYDTGVFRTDDSGKTFVQLGKIDSIDLVAVDFSDPDRQTLLGSTHEQRPIYKSTDGGSTWNEISGNIPASINNCGYPLILDTQTYLMTCAQFGGGVGGIVKSVDGGETWLRVSEIACDQAPLLASNGAIYWSVQGNGGLVKSTDAGETWTLVSHAPMTIHPIELPDGKIVSANKDYLLVSPDGGKTWHPASPSLPYLPTTFTYSVSRRAFYVSHISTAEVIPEDAISSYEYDYEIM